MQNQTLEALEIASNDAKSESRAAERILKEANREVERTTQILGEATIFLESAGATESDCRRANAAEANAAEANAAAAQSKATLAAAQAKSRAASAAYGRALEASAAQAKSKAASAAYGRALEASAALAAAPKEDALASQQTDIDKDSSTEEINTNPEQAPVQATTAQPNRTIFQIIADFFFYILNLLRSFFSPAAEGIYRTAQAEVASTTQLLREPTIFLESTGATAAELEQHNRAEAKAVEAELTAAQAQSRAASRAHDSANRAADDALNSAIARYRAAFDASDRLMSEMMGGTPTPDIVSKHLDAERNTALAAIEVYNIAAATNVRPHAMPEIMGNVIKAGVDVAAALAYQETFSKEGLEAAEKANKDASGIAYQNRHAFFQQSGEGSVPLPNLDEILKLK